MGNQRERERFSSVGEFEQGIFLSNVSFYLVFIISNNNTYDSKNRVHK